MERRESLWMFPDWTVLAGNRKYLLEKEYRPHMTGSRKIKRIKYEVYGVLLIIYIKIMLVPKIMENKGISLLHL